MTRSATERVAELVRHAGILRSRDLGAIPRQYLRLAEGQGKVTRIARGLYVATDADVTEHHDLALAAKRVPHGVVCLLSALRFHELTTQMPFEVWLAIHPKARLPYWHFHEKQDYSRNHAAHYADGKVVPLRGSTRRPLKRVK
jgi:predicted transcriptional regulator of viral defense system